MPVDMQPELKTFYHDELLPSLPLPSIHQTIEKYLDSCKAILSDEEYRNTENLCNKFKENEALSLQVLLMQKAIKERNWLEKWWLDKAYLEFRKPIMYTNFAGPGPYMEENMWPPIDNSQLERASIGLYIVMKFWYELKTEVTMQHKASDGSPLSMHQMRCMFNTCRIPKPERDDLHHSFKTLSEGESPTHVIVFCRNRIYKIPAVNARTGKIYTPPEFHKMLHQIKYSMARQSGQGVGALTCLDRDTWSDVRQYLIDLSSVNKQNLCEIESSLVCLCLDESNPVTYTDMLKVGMFSACGNKWSDKSFNYICTENGVLVACNDHTPYEAMVLIVFTLYTFETIKKMKGKWHDWSTEEVETPVELEFHLDGKVNNYIKQGNEEYEKFTSSLDVSMTNFDRFGKKALKALKVHPDGFIQICLQLAYIRLHGKPAPTYETATTRGFYHGRTETCRTCTTEAVAFCKSFIAGSPDVVTLFRQAHDKFLWLMNECKQNRGCDRHLFGLALQALESGEKLPALFTDPAFVKTGGNGNFVLSTSLTGYSYGTGVVSPMVEDGYGFFYRIVDGGFLFSVAAWKHSVVTNRERFAKAVCKAFNDVYEMLESDSSKL